MSVSRLKEAVDLRTNTTEYDHLVQFGADSKWQHTCIFLTGPGQKYFNSLSDYFTNELACHSGYYIFCKMNLKWDKYKNQIGDGPFGFNFLGYCTQKVQSKLLVGEPEYWCYLFTCYSCTI